jgi:ribosomal protein L29
MKRNDIKELQTKDQSELKTLLKEKRESLFTSQLDHSLGKLTNTASLRMLKDDIARILTVLELKKEETHGKTA